MLNTPEGLRNPIIATAAAEATLAETAYLKGEIGLFGMLSKQAGFREARAFIDHTETATVESHHEKLGEVSRGLEFAPDGNGDLKTKSDYSGNNFMILCTGPDLPEINDTGHYIGDAYLVNVATAMMQGVKNPMTRIGGDGEGVSHIRGPDFSLFFKGTEGDAEKRVSTILNNFKIPGGIIAEKNPEIEAVSVSMEEALTLYNNLNHASWVKRGEPLATTENSARREFSKILIVLGTLQLETLRADYLISKSKSSEDSAYYIKYIEKITGMKYEVWSEIQKGDPKVREEVRNKVIIDWAYTTLAENGFCDEYIQKVFLPENQPQQIHEIIEERVVEEVTAGINEKSHVGITSQTNAEYNAKKSEYSQKFSELEKAESSTDDADPNSPEYETKHLGLVSPTEHKKQFNTARNLLRSFQQSTDSLTENNLREALELFGLSETKIGEFCNSHQISESGVGKTGVLEAAIKLITNPQADKTEKSNLLTFLQKEAINYIKSHDSLTGLPTRKEYYQALKNNAREYAEDRDPTKFAVAYTDLSFIGYFNKTGGRETGSANIIQAVLNLEKSAEQVFGPDWRKNIEIYRVGGDELALIAKSPNAYEKLQELMKSAMAESDNTKIKPVGSAKRPGYIEEGPAFNYKVVSLNQGLELVTRILENGGKHGSNNDVIFDEAELKELTGNDSVFAEKSFDMAFRISEAEMNSSKVPTRVLYLLRRVLANIPSEHLFPHCGKSLGGLDIDTVLSKLQESASTFMENQAGETSIRDGLAKALGRILEGTGSEEVLNQMRIDYEKLIMKIIAEAVLEKKMLAQARKKEVITKLI